MQSGSPARGATPVAAASRLDGVLYDLRGPVHERASELESRGHSILRLNIGNPAPFGFEAPPAVIDALRQSLPTAHGYSDSAGLPSAREAVADHLGARDGFPTVGADDVFLGNGVSELVGLALQALLDPGDEILIPSPDYPLWTASAVFCGARVVHYDCDESTGWQPDIESMEALMGPRTRAIVVITPNNPTGAVYSRGTLAGIAEIAARHDVLLLSDEIYDRIVYDDAVHISTAQVAADQPVLTFGGLSKTHRVAGFRAGWVAATGFGGADPYLRGLRLLASMRMCASVPAQHAIAAALRCDDTLPALVDRGGRLHAQRDAAVRGLNAIPGVDLVSPDGGLYVFPRLTPERYDIHDDERLVLDFLSAEHVLLVHGRAFNWRKPDHVRIAFLPEVETLTVAIERFGNFLASYTQGPRAGRREE